jgi:hypothetical protein
MMLSAGTLHVSRSHLIITWMIRGSEFAKEKQFEVLEPSQA